MSLLLTVSIFSFLLIKIKNENPSVRLPYKYEVPSKLLEASTVGVIKEDFLLINTHVEIDLFDIFPDLTTAYDYGFISFASKSEGFTSYKPDKPEYKKEYVYWDIMNSNDKKLIEEYLSFL